MAIFLMLMTTGLQADEKANKIIAIQQAQISEQAQAIDSLKGELAELKKTISNHSKSIDSQKKSLANTKNSLNQTNNRLSKVDGDVNFYWKKSGGSWPNCNWLCKSRSQRCITALSGTMSAPNTLSCQHGGVNLCLCTGASAKPL